MRWQWGSKREIKRSTTQNTSIIVSLKSGASWSCSISVDSSFDVSPSNLLPKASWRQILHNENIVKSCWWDKADEEHVIYGGRRGKKINFQIKFRLHSNLSELWGGIRLRFISREKQRDFLKEICFRSISLFCRPSLQRQPCEKISRGNFSWIIFCRQVCQPCLRGPACTLDLSISSAQTI